MLSKRLPNIFRKRLINKRSLHKTAILNEEREHPLWRTLRILRDDVSVAKRALLNQNYQDLLNEKLFPRHVDALVIGGGAIGSSIAYWLKEKTIRDQFRVAVIEKDPSVNNFCMRFFYKMHWNICSSIRNVQLRCQLVDSGNSFHFRKIFVCHYLVRNF